MNKLFKFVSPLIKDEDDAEAGDKSNDDAFKQEQQKVARLVYKIDPSVDAEAEETALDVSMDILTKMRAEFGKGTERRIVHTLPPLIYYALGLIEQKKKESEEAPSKVSLKKIFQFIHKTITALNDHAPLVSIQLWLVGAVAADKIAADPVAGDAAFAPISAEFISQAWEVFEDKATDSVDVRACLLQFIGTFGCLQMYALDDYNNGRDSCVKNANKMIKKKMKVEMLCAASVLFGTSNESYVDAQNCLACCQKVLKIVDQQVQSDPKEVGLWVEMLCLYLYYIVKFPDTFNSDFIAKIRQLCIEHLGFAKEDNDAKEAAEKALVYLAHTEKYVKALKQDKPDQYSFWVDQ